MWQFYQCILFCVTCSILSFLLLPGSVAFAVVCFTLALGFQLNDYLLWRYFSVHVASIYYWIVTVYYFLANMYHQSNISNGPVRKFIDDSGTSGNSIGLYRKNNPNPKYNLISSYSLQNESGLSKSFQSPLRSLSYNIDSSLSQSSRGENENNSELYVVKASKFRSSAGAGIDSPKYENLSSVRVMEPLTETGLLTPSTRFNLNLNPKLYADINSPGFCGRVAEKLNESMTHQTKYSTVGAFPIVNLNSKSPKPYLSHRNSQAVAKTPVRVRIAPPDMSLSSLDSSILRHTSIGSDESMKSVLQVLREISRKRIHSQENEEVDDNTKRIKTSEFEDVTMEEQPITDQQAQGKRPREDSPRNEEVKRQRRQFRNNEILSSLSSSMTIQPPHLQQPKKRKAQHEEDLQASVSTKEKLLKFQYSPTPPVTPIEKGNAHVDIKQQQQSEVIIESLQETSKQLITETPKVKKPVPYQIPQSAAVQTPSKTESPKGEDENIDSLRIFGRFAAGKLDGGRDEHNHNDQKNENGMSKVFATLPKEQTGRLQEMFSSIEGRDNFGSIPISNKAVVSLLNSDETQKQKSVEAVKNTESFNSNVVTKPLSGILGVSTPGKKSVTFSDPIAVTKLISHPVSESSSSSLSNFGEKSELPVRAPTKDSVVTEVNTEKGGGDILSGSPMFNVGGGFSLSKTESSQTFSNPVSISASTTTTTVQDFSKPSFSFNTTPASSASPKPVGSFNSTSVASDVFKSSLSSLTNALHQTSAASLVTQTNSPKLVSPFAMSTPVSQTTPLPSISFSSSTSNPTMTSSTSTTSTPIVFSSVTTSAITTTSGTSRPGIFSFSSSASKKETENAVPSNVFSTSQSFSLTTGNTMFGNLPVKSTSNTSTAENKSIFSTSTTSESTIVSAKPTFAFGSSNITDSNQNKPMFGNVFSNATTTAAEKTSNPFGNVFNSQSTTQSNPVLSGFVNSSKTTTILADGFSTSTAQSATTIFPTSSTNSLQSPITSVFDTSKTNLQKTDNSSHIFGGTPPNLEIKTDNFGTAKPATKGFSFTPATTSSNIFGNVFGTSTPAQSSIVAKPTPAFGGFETPQVTSSTTPSPFSFGSTTTSHQSSPAFGTVPPSTTAAPVFNFGSNSVQSNSVFGAPMNSTSQTNCPFGSVPTPPTTLAFGTATPNSTIQSTSFGINSPQKTSLGFGITSNSSQTSTAFGIPTTNATPTFNTPAANSGFSSLNNGTATNNSTFGGFGTTSTASPFTFGGTASNPGTFAFGGASTSASSSGGGFGTPTKPVTFNTTPAQPAINPPSNVFTFGQTPVATPASTQLNFQYNAGSTQPSIGGFNFNSTSANPPNAFQIGTPLPAPPTMFTLGAGSSTPRPKARLRRQK